MVCKSLVFKGLSELYGGERQDSREDGVDSLAGKSLEQDVPRTDWDWKSQLRERMGGFIRGQIMGRDAPWTAWDWKSQLRGRGRFGAAGPQRPTGKRDKTSRYKIPEKKSLPHFLHLKLKT